MHQDLKLVRGLPPTPGDALAVDKNEVIPLISQQSGFTLDNTRMWSPRYPSLRGGGTWKNNDAYGGRQLVRAIKTNVIETINLKLSAGTYTQAHTRIAKLNEFIDTARAYSASNYEWRPVYLEWHAQGAPGPQYALVYNIEVAVNWLNADAIAAGVPIADVVLRVEREPTWSITPPGGPFALENYTSLNVTGLMNAVEWANGFEQAPTAKNWIAPDVTIGDAPSELAITITSQNIERFYMWRSTRPLDTPQQSANSSFDEADGGFPRWTLNATDGYPDNATFTTDTNYGLLGPRNTVTRQVVTFDATQDNIVWPPPSGTYSPDDVIDTNSMRGKFNVFARGYYNGPATTNIKLQLQVTETNHGSITMDDVDIKTVVNGKPELTYLGTLTLPFQQRIRKAPFNDAGYASYPRDATLPSGGDDSQLRFSLDVTGFGGFDTYTLIDLIFVPYDEPLIVIDISSSDPTTHRAVTYSTRRGETRGLPQDSVYVYNTSAVDVPDDLIIEMRGEPLFLLPGTDNAIAFIIEQADDATSDHSTETFSTSGTLYPRWYGARTQ